MAGFVRHDSSNNCITVSPKDGAQSATIILSHGLGDTAEGFQNIGEALSYHFPYIKFIIPTAPIRAVSLNGGMHMPAWYDIKSFSDNQCEGIDESAEIIRSLIESEVSVGLPYSRIAIGGFSQGAALSLFVGLQLPIEKKLAGILVMSGYLAADSRFKLTPGLESTKILHCHGTADPLLGIDKALLTKETLLAQGLLSYELVTIHGMSHTINEDVMKRAVAFLSEVLPQDDSFLLQPKAPSEMSVKELKAAIRTANIGSKALGLSEKHEFVKLLEDYRAGALL